MVEVFRDRLHGSSCHLLLAVEAFELMPTTLAKPRLPLHQCQASHSHNLLSPSANPDQVPPSTYPTTHHHNPAGV
jgi:hypothetical protein